MKGHPQRLWVWGEISKDLGREMRFPLKTEQQPVGGCKGEGGGGGKGKEEGRRVKSDGALLGPGCRR